MSSSSASISQLRDARYLSRRRLPRPARARRRGPWTRACPCRCRRDSLRDLTNIDWKAKVAAKLRSSVRPSERNCWLITETCPGRGLAAFSGIQHPDSQATAAIVLPLMPPVPLRPQVLWVRVEPVQPVPNRRGFLSELASSSSTLQPGSVDGLQSAPITTIGLAPRHSRLPAESECPNETSSPSAAVKQPPAGARRTSCGII